MKLKVDDSWQEIVEYAYEGLDKRYRDFLEKDENFFPNYENFLNVFKTLKLQETRYILFGQDPYPRKSSATGYAFIDGDVKSIFSSRGLSKEVNRATSLRNFIKMLLVSEGFLDDSCATQSQIAKLEKSNFINSIDELRKNFEKNGVLLLNSALIFTSKKDSKFHIKMFKPFMKRLLERLDSKKVELILFGNSAIEIEKRVCGKNRFKSFKTLHPYNVGFICSLEVQKFFLPMKLLYKDQHR